MTEIPPYPAERWLPAFNYEGFYAISNWGRVRSLARIDQNKHWHPELILKPQPDKKGYLQVVLSKDGVKAHKFIHTLVLEAFVGPCPASQECCHHPDPDPANNHLENIRWDTRLANREDTRQQGRPFRQKLNLPVCKHGHEYTEENTYWYEDVRHCRACQRETMRSQRGALPGGQSSLEQQAAGKIRDERIFTLRAEGLSQAAIAHEVACSQQTVSNVLRGMFPTSKAR